jgi:hypothetical protein
MPQTEVDLCSAALVKLGALPIGSFDEPSAEAEVARRLYPLSCDALLGCHPWAFTMAQAELEREESPPRGDFAHAFLLPPDLVRSISAGTGGRGRGIVYRIVGSRLEADAAAVLLTYQRRTEAAEFPPHFVSALVARLAAEFCLPVTENASRAEILHRLASAELQLARLVDSQQATPRAVEDFALIDARFA